MVELRFTKVLDNLPAGNWRLAAHWVTIVGFEEQSFPVSFFALVQPVPHFEILDVEDVLS